MFEPLLARIIHDSSAVIADPLFRQACGQRARPSGLRRTAQVRLSSSIGGARDCHTPQCAWNLGMSVLSQWELVQRVRCTYASDEDVRIPPSKETGWKLRRLHTQGGGTKSSRSGEPYQVQCGNERPVPSSEWLGAVLHRLRSSPSAGSSNKYRSHPTDCPASDSDDIKDRGGMNFTVGLGLLPLVRTVSAPSFSPLHTHAPVSFF